MKGNLNMENLCYAFYGKCKGSLENIKFSLMGRLCVERMKKEDYVIMFNPIKPITDPQVKEIFKEGYPDAPIEKADNMESKRFFINSLEQFEYSGDDEHQIFLVLNGEIHFFACQFDANEVKEGSALLSMMELAYLAKKAFKER